MASGRSHDDDDDDDDDDPKLRALVRAASTMGEKALVSSWSRGGAERRSFKGSIGSGKRGERHDDNLDDSPLDKTRSKAGSRGEVSPDLDKDGRGGGGEKRERTKRSSFEIIQVGD